MDDSVVLQSLMLVQDSLVRLQETVMELQKSIIQLRDDVRKLDERLVCVEGKLANLEQKNALEFEALHTYIAQHDVIFVENEDVLETVKDLLERVIQLEQKVARHGRMLRKAL